MSARSSDLRGTSRERPARVDRTAPDPVRAGARALVLVIGAGYALSVSGEARRALDDGRPLKIGAGGPSAQNDAGAKVESPRPENPGEKRGAKIDEAARAALELGLTRLAVLQAREADGSFPGIGAPASPALGEDSGRFPPVAVAALGALAYMAGGSTPDRGPHGHEISAAIDYLLANAQSDSGAPSPGWIGRASDTQSRMHGHGFAALALAQAYSMSPRSARGARLERALQAAITCIESSQGIEGGWYYEPHKGLQHEGSITICMVQALRAAHNSGLKVDPATIARAIEYVSHSQKPDGSFRYALADDSSSIALTAAAISTLNATGAYGGRAIEEGYAWLFRALAVRDASGSPAPNPLQDQRTPSSASRRIYCPFYERLVVAQALWQNPDPRAFVDWSSRERPRVIASQEKDGSWHDARFGDCYATAMSCLFLALPEGLLPIFQR